MNCISTHFLSHELTLRILCAVWKLDVLLRDMCLGTTDHLFGTHLWWRSRMFWVKKPVPKLGTAESCWKVSDLEEPTGIGLGRSFWDTSRHFKIFHIYLGGGNSNSFYVHPYLGKMNPFWRLHIFQRGGSTINGNVGPTGVGFHSEIPEVHGHEKDDVMVKRSDAFS